MKQHVSKYIQFFGRDKALKKIGDILWKLLEWFWFNNRKILRGYIQITKNIALDELYRKITGKNFKYRGEVTLNYIRWLYRQRKLDLSKFMKDTYPVL